MTTLNTKSEKLHHINKAYKTTIKQKRVFVWRFNTKKITCETIRNQLSQSSLFKQERRGDSQGVISNCVARQQALCNRRIANAYRMDLVYCLAQRCKLLFSATITLPDLTRINLYTELWVRGCRAVSKLVKTALNTAITVKLLKSKVTYMRIYAKSVTLGI